MNLQEIVTPLIGQEENDSFEYKAILPPSKSIAQIIASFANTHGGILVLGISNIDGIRIIGLSEEFRATAITHKAIDLLKPKPSVNYDYIDINGKSLFVIKVDKSNTTIYIEDKVYKKIGSKTVLSNPQQQVFSPIGYERIQKMNTIIGNFIPLSTNSKIKILEHYQSILKIIDDLSILLYPENPQTVTTKKEGRILSRILYSSFVDNFETYLSDLLFEICLAKPQTLRSKETVEIEDILKCSDIQEFIVFWAKKKIDKLQKGSVKGFIEDTKQIRELKVIDKENQNKIEKILQIRHLYSHRNGIIDDKFRKHFLSAIIGDEHQMTIDEILNVIEYLSVIVNQIDKEAILKYKLSTI